MSLSKRVCELFLYPVLVCTGAPIAILLVLILMQEEDGTGSRLPDNFEKFDSRVVLFSQRNHLQEYCSHTCLNAIVVFRAAKRFSRPRSKTAQIKAPCVCDRSKQKEQKARESGELNLEELSEHSRLLILGFSLNTSKEAIKLDIS